MQDRRCVLKLAVFANRGRLAIAVRLSAINSQRGDRLVGEQVPKLSPIAIKGERSSTYLPANGFSITAIAAARRVGGATVCPISRYVSSTTVTILRMTALIVFRPAVRVG